MTTDPNGQPVTGDLEIVDSSFDGPHGSVPIRIYRVAGSQPRSGLLWLHGGAFMFGDLDMPESHWVAQQLVSSDRVVVTAHYRLAPIPEAMAGFVPPREGFHFPVASEELTALFVSLSEGTVIPSASRWALGGASAGGNLAAGAAMRLRDDTAHEPHAVLLVYPLLHAELPALRQELEDKVSALPTEGKADASSVAALNLHYAGEPAALSNPYAFPGGHDLEHFPPTLIINSDGDALRASGEAFASELAAAGVDVTVVREQGTVHGHINGPANHGAEQSIKRIKRWLCEREDDEA